MKDTDSLGEAQAVPGPLKVDYPADSSSDSLPIVVRVQQRQPAALDTWIIRQGEPLLSRAEAMQRLAEVGLLAKPNHPSPKGVRTAAALAGSQLDRMADPSASDEERQSRKRRLLKGPKEFRESRKDAPSLKK